MGIRDEPVIRQATLPSGEQIDVRVIVPDDPYIPRDQLDTVVVELERDGEPLGVVETPLSSDDVDEALLLAERIRTGLESGSLEPSAEGIESLASAPPA